MLVEVADTLGYEMPHRTFLSILEKVIQAQAMEQVGDLSGVLQGEDLTEEDALGLKEELEGVTEDGGSRSLQGVEDPPSEGFLEQGVEDPGT